MSTLAKVSYFWRSAAGGLRHSPFVHFIAITTIAIALFAAGLARTAGRALDGLLASLGGEVEVTVYLAPELTAGAGAGAARGQLEAGQRWHGRAGESGRGADAAVARSWEIWATRSRSCRRTRCRPRWSCPWRRSGALRRGSRRWRSRCASLPGVTGVDYGREAVERLTAIAKALRYRRAGGLRGGALRHRHHRGRHAAAGHLRAARGDRDPEAGGCHGALRQGALPHRGAAAGAAGRGGGAVGPVDVRPAGGAHAELAVLVPAGAGRPRSRWCGRCWRWSCVLAGSLLGLVGSFIAVGRFSRV